MKSYKLYLIIWVCFTIIVETVAQNVPQGINYQAVARDNAGKVLDNQAISIKMVILDSTAAGSVLYEETHQDTTNAYGLFTLVIGQGSPLTGTFDSIEWGNGAKFLQIAIDPEGGNDFIEMAISQLLSVPYALYAENAYWIRNGNDIFYNQGYIGIGAETPKSGFAIKKSGSNAYLMNRETGGLYLSANGKTGLIVNPNGEVSLGNGARIYDGLTVSSDLSISGTDNNGSSAPLHIRSRTQNMLIDGNEIDSNVNLYLNHNNSNDVIMVTGGGRVGIGTPNPKSYIHVVHEAKNWGGDGGLRLENADSHHAWVFYTDEDDRGSLHLYFKESFSNLTTFLGEFRHTDGSYQKKSDARFKKNVASLKNILPDVMQLNAKRYHFLNQKESDQLSLGFIAQEVQPLFPELVGYAGEEQDIMTLNYDGFSVLAIKAIQEQQTVIRQLQQRLEALEKLLKPEK